MTGGIEKLADENHALRQQSGMAATDDVELSGIRLAKVKLTYGFWR